MKITNNSPAMQGIQTVCGAKFIPPGETKDLDLTKAQAERAGRLKFLSIKGDPVEELAPSIDAVGADGKDGVYLKAEEFNDMRQAFEARDAEIKRLQEDNDDLRKQLEAMGKEAANGYAVTEKSPGWFVITKDGEAVTKSLRKDDVEGFDAMSDEDKAALVDLHKAD